jgi:hypothetical protein
MIKLFIQNIEIRFREFLLSRKYENPIHFIDEVGKISLRNDAFSTPLY